MSAATHSAGSLQDLAPQVPASDEPTPVWRLIKYLAAAAVIALFSLVVDRGTVIAPQHLLSSLLSFPLLGALIVAFMPRQWVNGIRFVSMLVLCVEFVMSGYILHGDYSTSQMQFIENAEWVPSLGIGWRLGVDGISCWLVLLTTALTPISLYVSWNAVSTKVKEYAISFLLLQVGMLGAFISLDLFLFYVFWELMLVPMYLIIGVWGGKDRIYAAVKFFLYTMFGSLLMLVAILYVVAEYHDVTGVYSFAWVDIANLQLPAADQIWLFVAFALAFAIKVPMFPLHTWLPDAHVQAPTGGSVILAAVLLKLGGYGFLRYAMPLFPFASHYLGPTIAVFAVIGILYGAVCAWVQRDVKKLVAYSSVSHLGFVMLGILSVTQTGISGAILQMVSHGISTGALFILVGVIYDRRHTRDLADFGGLAKVMPAYTVVFVIVTMSSVGLPGTNGFVGEFMILAGSFVSQELGNFEARFVFFAAMGVILAAVYMLHAVLKMFWGPVDKKENEGLADLTHRERIALAPLVVAIFWIGLYPSSLLDTMQPSVEHLVSTYTAGYTADQRVESPGLRIDLADDEEDEDEDEGEAAMAPHADRALADVLPGGAR
jgi:NADH-quinone oxidoreductase subunit M